jgi:hypothetical protein
MYIKYSKKSHYIREYGNAVQKKPLRFNSRIQRKGILENNNQIKGIRECLIKRFIFYYNSIYTVYKDAKYNTG